MTTKQKIKDFFKNDVENFREPKQCEICKKVDVVGEFYLGLRNGRFIFVCSECFDLNDTENRI